MNFRRNANNTKKDRGGVMNHDINTVLIYESHTKIVHLKKLFLC